MNDPSRYPAKVAWSDEDGGFIAIAPDLPGCSAFGESGAEAIEELRHAIVAWQEACASAGNPVPPPSTLTPPDAKGKVLLRMPPSLHQTVIERADGEGVSINLLLVTAVAAYVGQGRE